MASTCSRRPSPATDWASSRPRPPSPRCTPTPARPRRPTGRRSWSGTTNWCASPALRWRASTGSAAVAWTAAPRAGLAALAGLAPALPRYAAVAAYLHERDGDQVTAARLYAEAARSASNLPERDHLTRQVARLNSRLRG